MRKTFVLYMVTLLLASLFFLGCATTPYVPPANTSTNETVSTNSTALAPPEVAQYAADWPLPNRDYSNTRETTDAGISSANVNNLAPVWASKILGVGAFGGAASNPIILGNTVYFQDLKSNIFAFDLRNGNVKWQKIYNLSLVEGPNGPAVGWGKIFYAKDTYTMTAADLNTGNELWSQTVSTVNGTGVDIQPLVYDGMVYVSTVPGTSDVFYAPGGIGMLYALGQANGSILWNFSTVDDPNLWGHPEVNSGGGAWYSPSIDEITGMMFWGIGNPAPFPGTTEWPNGASRPGPNLYTDSIVSIDHKNGKLAWYTQVLGHDIQDHDFQIPPILVDGASVSGTRQDIVIGAGKMGEVYAFNRDSGEILWATSVGVHTPNNRIDQFPANETMRMFPGVLGGVETPMAYSDGVVYVPVVDMFSDWNATNLDYSTLNFASGAGGELVAINVTTGNVIWYKVFNSTALGGATVVNDLVFTATFDGTIYAFDKGSGEQLWNYTAPAGINAWPAVAGNTIIWPAGVGENATVIALSTG